MTRQGYTDPQARADLDRLHRNRQTQELRQSLQAWMRAAIGRGYPARLCRDVVEAEGMRIKQDRGEDALTELARLGQAWDAGE